MSPSQTLASAKSQTVNIIVELVGDPVLVARLRELGFTRGESVLMRGRAPFGDPLLVELRGFVVALRKAEAECVRV